VATDLSSRAEPRTGSREGGLPPKKTPENSENWKKGGKGEKKRRGKGEKEGENKEKEKKKGKEEGKEEMVAVRQDVFST